MSVLEQFHYSISCQIADEKQRSEAPKLVFLHGVMGFASNWRKISRAFETTHEVLDFDQRGHGRSFQPESGYSPEDYASDLKKILDELGWSSIDLVGHSMGGRVAFCFANLHPEMIRRLVIEDIGPAMQAEGANLVVRILDAVKVPFKTRAEAKAYFEGEFLVEFRSDFFGDSPNEKGLIGLSQFLYANIKDLADGRCDWRFSAKGVRESVRQGRLHERWEDIRGLTMPTLVIRGQQSRDLPDEIFKQMLKENSQIEGAVIEDTGHWVHSEQPDRFTQTLREFLTKNR
jgi:esterase